MGTSVSRAITAHIRTIVAALAAFALALALAPMAAFADDTQAESAGTGTAQVDSVAGPLAGPGYENDARSASPNSALSPDGEGVTLASALAGSAASIVSADVALDSANPIVGSFTTDGLTYAVGTDGLTLVAVAPDAAADGAASIPASVTYDGVTYDVTSVGPYAFYLSGATSVELPVSILSVDSRAFRSSDVARVEVAADNPTIASFDGCLYDSQLTSLLLIPEGRAGAVLLPETAEVIQASKFSHCSLVDAISVEEGGADFASWDGLLYDASGTTLLRVPAGTTEVTVRDGCTTIAAGALEGCAKLERINGLATVTSISPDVFQSVPTVTLPAQMAVQDGATSGVASSLLDQANASTGFAPQLTAMVAFSTADDDLPEVDPSSIEVLLPEDADQGCWKAAGFLSLKSLGGNRDALAPSVAMFEDADSNRAGSFPEYVVNIFGAEGYRCIQWNKTFTIKLKEWTHGSPSTTISRIESWNVGGNKFGYWTDVFTYSWDAIPFKTGYTLKGFTYSDGSSVTTAAGSNQFSATIYCDWRPNAYTVAFDLNSGPGAAPASIVATYDQDLTLPAPAERPGYRFLGWNTAADGSGSAYQPGAVRNLTTADGTTITLYAQWSYSLGFDTDSEPDDVDYPGEGIDDRPVTSDEGQVEIEDPKRPGYVFEGWVIPNADGIEAVDQDLVYQGDDGKWYVDASKLPDYADSDGKIELTARWTSVISVDVPSSVTFYADLVTQGQESREGATEGAFGQNKVANQSEVDLRVVGLESSAVKTDGSTLGADSILKKKDGSAVSGTGDKLLSLYPTDALLDADDLRDPDAVSAGKPDGSVDFSLDDILLEGSFTSKDLPADAFTIATGKTLNMGYRLNLAETDTVLDYGKLSTLSEGQSASIANVSYCFAADALPSDWDEPLWIENPDRTSNPAKYLLLDDIKEAADDLSANGTSSEYYATYKGLLDAQVMDNGNPGAGPYFQLKVDGVYLPVQLIGICQDTKSDGTGKAGLTFQMRDIYACYNRASDAAGGGAFNYTYMNPSDTNAGGWGSSSLRRTLRSVFWDDLPPEVQKAIAPVDKYQQLPGGTSASYLQKTTDETIWLPSACEVGGTSFRTYNESERQAANGYVPFQYMAYQGNSGSGLNKRSVKVFNGEASFWWLRSAYRDSTTTFFGMSAPSYGIASGGAKGSGGAVPCFCL